MYHFVVLLLAIISGSLASPIVPEDNSPPINGRIIGGNSTIIALFPYMVSILHRDYLLCSGVIIGEDTILTAAHCVSPAPEDDLKIRAGSTYWDTTGEIFDVVAIKTHEKYNPKTMENDIAVMRLNSSLEFGHTKQPIGVAKNSPENGTDAVVSGWGRTIPGVTDLPLSLYYIPVNIVGRYECASPKYLHGDHVLFGMICARGPGRDACDGDDGSPLVADGLLVGLFSWSSGCANENYPGVYCDVANFAKWIESAVQTV